MKIVVIGGTGLIGSKLVKLLRDRGQEVLAASPDSGVNTLTGEGLPAALAGAQVVVDVSNSPSFEDAAVLKFFQTATGNLLAGSFLQIEFAGILKGTQQRTLAEHLIDFMLSKRFQEDVPLQMFVYPVLSDAAQPDVFKKFAQVPEQPLGLPPEPDTSLTAYRYLRLGWTATNEGLVACAASPISVSLPELESKRYA